MNRPDVKNKSKKDEKRIKDEFMRDLSNKRKIKKPLKIRINA